MRVTGGWLAPSGVVGLEQPASPANSAVAASRNVVMSCARRVIRSFLQVRFHDDELAHLALAGGDLFHRIEIDARGDRLVEARDEVPCVHRPGELRRLDAEVAAGRVDTPRV